MQVYDYSYEMPTLRQKMAVLMPLLVANAVLADDAPRALPGWSYDGNLNGQQHWADLSPAYALCEDGHAQSPINISFTKRKRGVLPKLVPTYHLAKAHVVHTKHILQLNFKNGGVLKENGDTYVLRHIQFHTPSEHTIKEHAFPLEIQFVHQDAKGKLLILAAFANVGGARSGFDPILNHIDNPEVFDYNATSILPTGGGYYAYSGSLTYPPCMEGVEWRVLKRPMSISKEQFNRIADLVKRNGRMVQPVYMRVIQETKE